MDIGPPAPERQRIRKQQSSRRHHPQSVVHQAHVGQRRRRQSRGPHPSPWVHVLQQEQSPSRNAANLWNQADKCESVEAPVSSSAAFVWSHGKAERGYRRGTNSHASVMDTGQHSSNTPYQSTDHLMENEFP